MNRLRTRLADVHAARLFRAAAESPQPGNL